MAPRTRDPFSVSRMKEVYDDCSETLLTAIKRQNPDVNADQFDMALRQLVMNFGNTNPLYPDMSGVLASIHNNVPIYSEAADILLLARNEYNSGNVEEALRCCIMSFDDPENDILFEALAANNEQAKSAVIDNSIDTEPDLVNKDNTEDSENWEDDTPLYNITDPDAVDDIDADSEDVEAKIKLIASREQTLSRRTPKDDADEDNEDNENVEDETTENDDDDKDSDSNEEESDEEDDDNDEDNTSVESSAHKKKFMLRIARNKLSLTGTDEALQRANSLRKVS